jgi:hypothetical protein
MAFLSGSVISSQEIPWENARRPKTGRERSLDDNAPLSSLQKSRAPARRRTRGPETISLHDVGADGTRSVPATGVGRSRAGGSRAQGLISLHPLRTIARSANDACRVAGDDRGEGSGGHFHHMHVRPAFPRPGVNRGRAGAMPGLRA